MLYWLLYPLKDSFSFLNVFKYITFRTFGAALTAVVLCMWMGPAFIRLLQRKQIGQAIRDDGPQSHLSKKGTPTMGGTLILIGLTVSTLLWSDLSNHYVWICLITTLLFAAIGYVDDYRKVVAKNPKGLSAKQKFLAQCLVGGCAAVALYSMRDTPSDLRFPIFKDWSIPLGIFFVPFSAFVIVGTSNAVNFTDGLDGLAVGPTIITSVTFLILAYCAGHVKIAEDLQIP